MSDFTKEQIEAAINSAGSVKGAAATLGIPQRTLFHLRWQLGMDTFINGRVKEPKVIIKELDPQVYAKAKKELDDYRLSVLRKENKKLLKEIGLMEEQISGLVEIKNAFDLMGTGQPDWLAQKRGNNDKSIASLMSSDEHWGEVVKAEQVNHVNSYDTPTARARYQKVTENFLGIINDQLKNVDMERMVLALGGDNVSGDIHAELTMTNDMTTMESVLDYVDHKKKGIEALLASGFKQIFIPCVRGNHDRNTRKTASKNVLETSSAYLVYHFLKKIFAGDKRVVFSIATGLDCLYKVNNHRMLLTHGDQFRGGGGPGGLATPILSEFYKKQASYAQTGNDFDSMIIGHFHQYTSIANGKVIINGSLKGYDEFAQRCGFPFQEACQAMWLTSQDRGITVQLPVYCDEPVKKEFRADDWISWKE